MIPEPGKVSASDAAAVMADPGTKLRHALVERLVQDHEGIDQHLAEHPDPWQVRHDEQVRAALVAAARFWTVEPGRVVESPVLSFLVAKVHAFRDGLPMLVRPHASMRLYTAAPARPNAAYWARAQITAYCCEAPSVNVLDFLDGLGRVPDRLRLRDIPFEPEKLHSQVLPRVLSVMEAVRARLRMRQAT